MLHVACALCPSKWPSIKNQESFLIPSVFSRAQYLLICLHTDGSNLKLCLPLNRRTTKFSLDYCHVLAAETHLIMETRTANNLLLSEAIGLSQRSHRKCDRKSLIPGPLLRQVPQTLSFSFFWRNKINHFGLCVCSRIIYEIKSAFWKKFKPPLFLPS